MFLLFNLLSATLTIHPRKIISYKGEDVRLKTFMATYFYFYNNKKLENTKIARAGGYINYSIFTRQKGILKRVYH